MYVRSMGKALRITAIFHMADEANAYLDKHTDEAVIAVIGDYILIANVYDKGVNIT